METVNSLLNMSPDSILEWIEIHKEETTFNWLGLAQVSLNSVYHSKSSKEDRLNWAKIPARVYELLSNDHSHDVAGMMLRAYLIKNFGAVKGDQLRDPEIIYSWFNKRVEHSFEDYCMRIVPLNAMPLEDLRCLRRLKNRISVLKLLVETVGADNAKIRNWVELWPKLP
jgi:hypothetical protein